MVVQVLLAGLVALVLTYLTPLAWAARGAVTTARIKPPKFAPNSFIPTILNAGHGLPAR